MHIKLICIGKTGANYLNRGIEDYISRLGHYCKFSLVELQAGKGDDQKIQQQERDILSKQLGSGDFVILLDETGKEYTSVEFSRLLAHHQNISTKNLVFVIGGAYGFSEEVYKRANAKMALSKMTFPHQLVRVIFLEQLYRALTILKGEKYHH